MPRDSFEFRIGFRKLLIGFLVTLVPVNLVALYAVSESARSLEVTVGTYFKTIAQSTAARITDFIHERATHVAIIASDPALIDMVTAANRSYEGMSDEAIARRIEETEAMWPTPKADALVNRIVSSPVSASLRHFLGLDPRFLRITVTDARGATVAATHKTIDYFQADEPYWQEIYNEGRGAVGITDVENDVVTKANYVGIGVPVLDPATNRFVGTLDALVEVSSLFPIVAAADIGATGRALLVKEDGTVIRGPDTTLTMGLKSEEFRAVMDALSSIHGRQTGYLVANLGEAGGETMIGFADTGLKEDFKNLGWVVLVAQPVTEAFAAVRTTQRLILLIAALAFLAVVFVGVYFSLHRKGEIEEIEEDFHTPLVNS
jgi:Cache domain